MHVTYDGKVWIVSPVKVRASGESVRTLSRDDANPVTMTEAQVAALPVAEAPKPRPETVIVRKAAPVPEPEAKAAPKPEQPASPASKPKQPAPRGRKATR